MNPSVSTVVVDTLEFLGTLNADAARPEEARQRLRALRARHSGTTIDLLWQEEAYDESVHYDALLRVDGTSTISLSVCPVQALPWPLRGVHRWNEHDLARVNGRVLEVSDAVRLLDFVWDEVRLMDRLLNAFVIREELDRDPITISNEELQHAMDAFRRARGLGTVDETRRWMEERGLTLGALEELVAERLMINALRERVTADRVAAYFDAHRADFDVALVAQFETTDEASARRVIGQIRGNEVSFLEAAERSFRDTSARRPPPPVFASIRRSTATDARGRAAFAARPGEVLDPVPTETGFAVVKLLAFEPARLDDATRNAIQGHLFEEWLNGRRRAARIEWFWGTAQQTRDRGAAARVGA